MRCAFPFRRFTKSGSAVAAVEFALLAPVFLLMLFGIVVYAVVLMTYSGVQQLTAESARATVGGLTDSERDQLARTFVATNVGAYPLLDPTRLTVATASLAGPPAGFKVTLTYDNSSSFVVTLAGIAPLVTATITRSAVVQQGGT